MNLLFCPFCEDKTEWVSKGGKLGNHICMNCGAMHKGDLTWDESAALWNTRPVKKSSRKHSFEDSPYFNFNKFKYALPKWSRQKAQVYYDKAIGYSEANGGKYLNWISAVKNWERSDKEKAGPVSGVNTSSQSKLWEPPDDGPIASAETLKNIIRGIGG